jgi:hypothetical protein
MNMKLATVVAALALGLGGCASDPGMGGMVYRDGGYYAPVRDGYGDYYVAPEYSDDWAGYDPFYGPFYDPFVFGPNWYGGGGGYCSVRYRYCPTGWYGYGSPFSSGFGTSLWLDFGTRAYYNPWGYYEPWGYSQPFHAWRPPHRRPTPPAQGSTQTPPWRPPTDAIGQTDEGGDGGDGMPLETGPDGRFLDDNGDGRPDERPLRRRLMRPQPMGAPVLIGTRPLPDASAAPSNQGGNRLGGGDRVDRNGGGGRERSERSEGGGRARTSGEGDDGAARTRRRDRDD